MRDLDDGGHALDDVFHLPRWVPETWSPPMTGVSLDDDHRPPPAHAGVTGTALRLFRRPSQLVRIWGRRRILVGSSPDADPTVVPLCGPLDVAGWRSAVLIVRVHEIVSVPGDGSLEVHVQRVETSPDEPSVVFTSGSYLATARVTAVGLKTVAWLGVMPARARVLLVSNSDKSIEGTQDVTLSIDLLGRFG